VDPHDRGSFGPFQHPRHRGSPRSRIVRPIPTSTPSWIPTLAPPPA
jgi:hypothetical protein